MLFLGLFTIAAAILAAAYRLEVVMSAGTDAIRAAIAEQGTAISATITAELGDIATAIENAANGSANEAELQALATQIRDATVSYTASISAMVNLPPA